MEKTDVAAVSPGPRELTLWNTFADLKARGTIPVIQSNVTIRRDGNEAPLGLESKVFTVNGVRVGVFSLMGGNEMAGVRAPDGTSFGFHDPFEKAAELVPALRQGSDLVVLMSQMSTGDTDRLIQTVPGIDVALYGARPVWQETARRKGETICNETSSRGQNAGELVIIVDPEGEIIDYGSRNIVLDDKVAESAEVLKRVNETTEKSKQMRDEARRARQAAQEKKLSGERYLGDENCRRCHTHEYDSWAATPHAQAFASLHARHSAKPLGPECVSCHVTGYGQGGFVPDVSAPDFRPAGDPDLANVQCEACHGAGTGHSRTGGMEVAESVCRACHTPEWSPSFDFALAIEQVRHR